MNPSDESRSVLGYSTSLRNLKITPLNACTAFGLVQEQAVAGCSFLIEGVDFIVGGFYMTP